VVFDGMTDALRCECCEVKNAVEAVRGEHVGDYSPVGDGPKDEFHALGQVGATSAVQVVQDHDVIASGDQGFNEVGPDEAGTAGHKMGRHVSLQIGIVVMRSG
jgi:hypothetical protein